MTKSSKLTAEDAKILEKYICDMEKIIYNCGKRIPCNDNTVRVKTCVMAIAAGN